MIEPTSPDLSVLGDFKTKEMTQGFMDSEVWVPGLPGEDTTKPVLPIRVTVEQQQLETSVTVRETDLSLF